jgi:hypothetical protein
MGAFEVGKVFSHTTARGNNKRVLLSIAWHIRDNSNDCWPGYEKIAHTAGIGRSTVATCIRSLVELGQLERITSSVVRSAKGWSKASNHYSLPDAWFRE